MSRQRRCLIKLCIQGQLVQHGVPTYTHLLLMNINTPAHIFPLLWTYLSSKWIESHYPHRVSQIMISAGGLEQPRSEAILTVLKSRVLVAFLPLHHPLNSYDFYLANTFFLYSLYWILFFIFKTLSKLK